MTKPADLSPPLRAAIAAMDSHPMAAVTPKGWDVPGVIPLWFGESDLQTPDFIADAARAALDRGETFYGFSSGKRSLIEAISAYTERLYGKPLPPHRITVPGSAMLSLTITLNTLVETGDNVVIVSPIWPNIFMAAQSMGAEPRFVRLDNRAADGTLKPWSLDLNRLFGACDARTKAIFISSPGNPTGWILSDDERRAILDFARAQRIAIISDEVYHRLVYDRPAAPSFHEIAEPDDPVFIIHSFSKGWAMTGWRLGWVVHPEALVKNFAIQSAVFNTGATAFIQDAGTAALDQGEDFVRAMVKRCEKGRARVMETLGAHPRIRLSEPEGAFYAFPEIDGLTDSLGFCRRVLDEAKVGLAPGNAFGPGNEAHIRLCFAQNPDLLDQALERLIRFL